MHVPSTGPTVQEQQVFWITESLLQALVVCQSFSWGDETHTALLTPDKEPMTDHSAFLWSLQKCLFKPFFQLYFVLVIEPSAYLANALPLTCVLRWLLLMSVCVRLVLRQGGLLLRSSACTYSYAYALLVFIWVVFLSLCAGSLHVLCNLFRNLTTWFSHIVLCVLCVWYTHGCSYMHAHVWREARGWHRYFPLSVFTCDLRWSPLEPVSLLSACMWQMP